jgi:hypothetical protein
MSIACGKDIHGLKTWHSLQQHLVLDQLPAILINMEKVKCTMATGTEFSNSFDPMTSPYE